MMLCTGFITLPMVLIALFQSEASWSSAPKKMDLEGKASFLSTVFIRVFIEVMLKADDAV